MSREPNYTFEEEILVMDLYLRHGKPIAAEHEDAIALSEYLGSLTIHDPLKRGDKFRNPNSIERKMGDIHSHRPGFKGKRTAGSALDTYVWNQFAHSLDEVHVLAQLIREDLDNFEFKDSKLDEEEDTYLEGRVLYRQHLRRERNKQLRVKKMAEVRDRFGCLKCEACDINLAERFGEERYEVYECHHIVPLAKTGPKKSKVTDLALLCPTCHRVAHKSKVWLSLSALRGLCLAKK